MVASLSAKGFTTKTFREQIPECDVAVIVKYPDPIRSLSQAEGRPGIIYCPIDYYGSCAEIDGDYSLLRACDRVVLHSESLRAYFQSYVPIVRLEHQIKHAKPIAEVAGDNDLVLWVGMPKNLPPLVRWMNHRRPDLSLLVLTKLDTNGADDDPTTYGFDDRLNVRIEGWSPERQQTAFATARAAIDVKGDDFRQRHKPPTKAVEFLAAGLPLAMNPHNNSAEQLARWGFEVAQPEDQERWFSPAYRRDARQFGESLRERLSLSKVADGFSRVINEVLAGDHADVPR